MIPHKAPTLTIEVDERQKHSKRHGDSLHLGPQRS